MLGLRVVSAIICWCVFVFTNFPFSLGGNGMAYFPRIPIQLWTSPILLYIPLEKAWGLFSKSPNKLPPNRTTFQGRLNKAWQNVLFYPPKEGCIQGSSEFTGDLYTLLSCTVCLLSAHFQAAKHSGLHLFLLLQHHFHTKISAQEGQNNSLFTEKTFECSNWALHLTSTVLNSKQ